MIPRYFSNRDIHMGVARRGAEAEAVGERQVTPARTPPPQDQS